MRCFPPQARIWTENAADAPISGPGPVHRDERAAGMSRDLAARLAAMGRPAQLAPTPAPIALSPAPVEPPEPRAPQIERQGLSLAQPPALPAEEETMPKGIPIAGRRKPCEECHSPTRHRKTCSKAAGAKPEKTARKRAPAKLRPDVEAEIDNTRRVDGSGFDLSDSGLSVGDLVALRAAIGVELQARHDRASAEADEIAKALGRAA